MANEYYHTKESVKEYIQLAKDVSGIQLIEKLQLILPENSKVLEIGSGPGTDWEILSKQYTVTGSDISKEFLNHLRGTYQNGEFIELDAVLLETNKIFNGIYSNKVLHHLKDDELVRSIKQQHDVLTPSGIICHSFWLGNGSETFKGMFVNYHTQKSLKQYFSNYFEIISLSPYAEFEENDSILLIGRKK